MRKIGEITSSAKVFLDEVLVEMRKTNWPQRGELIESTVMVIVSVLLLSAFVGLSDKIVASLLRLIIPTG
jgi:preprotein translocase subunit SecE